ncbi:MAG: hypothetical protein HY293_11485 [Planctomycetes bacterium]|nr:hypothetical protein [Planctomycetota bacterium]
MTLEFRGFEPAPAEIPELDSLWRVAWIAEPPREKASGFRWPVLACPPESERLPGSDGERWEPYFTSRLELGAARLRAIETAPVVYPAISRAILGLPLGLIEAVTTLTLPDTVIVNGRRVFDQVDATEDLATITGRTLLMAELKFFASLRTSEINKFGAQEGTEDLDQQRFNRLQWRALFNATKSAYRERFEIPSLDLDTILSALSTGDWMDFIIVPAAVSVYAARFGIDRKIRVSDDFRIELQIEKATRFQKVLTTDHGGRLFSASLNFFKLPVSAIVSLEAAPHGVGFEFIGIGTDVNTALCAINNYEAPRDRR